jgi:hypothetical protein
VTTNELEEAASKLQKHYAYFRLIMHSTTKSKSEAMHFPPSLTEVKELGKKGKNQVG